MSFRLMSHKNTTSSFVSIRIKYLTNNNIFSNLKSGFQVKLLANKPIHEHLSVRRQIQTSAKSLTDDGGNANDKKDIHINNELNHRTKGSIYHEILGPDAKIIYIADPKFCAEIFRNECPYPRHVIPNAWRTYNNKHDVTRGLFFMDGIKWKESRRKLDQLLLKKEVYEKHALPWSFKVTDLLMQDWLNRWEENANNTFKNVEKLEIENLEIALHKWSVESSIASLFGPSFFLLDIDSKKTIVELIQSVQSFFEASADLQFVDSDEACEKQTIDWIKFETAMHITLELVSEITHKCLHINNELDPSANVSLVSQMLEKGFEISQVLALIQDLIIASADTTSYSTLWSFHLLALYEDVQEKARKEVIKYLEYDRFSVQNFKYIRWCNKESMRLFPIAPFLTRILDKPVRLTEEWNENILKKDQLILLSTYAMSRNSNNFNNPEEFCPERWEKQRNSFACLPFGHGARKCIGMKLAENQMVYFLVKVLENFRLKSENQNEVKYKMKMIGVPDRPIKISLCRK